MSKSITSSGPGVGPETHAPPVSEAPPAAAWLPGADDGQCEVAVSPLLASVDERQLRAELRRRGTLVAHTVYECSSCGERSVGERRCQECNLFSRALGLGGHCNGCDEPMLLAELLELEVAP